MYLFFMALATLLSWGAWILVLYTTNPDEAGTGGFVLFYVTLLLGLIGTLTLFGMAYRLVLLRRQSVIAREVRISFRHAVFLSSVAVGALALSARGWLRGWVFLVCIILMSIIEYLFLLREEARRT
jgi:hypothetical protein